MNNTIPSRKVRFVLISDTHNAAPGGAFKLPRGDVLIHAGDMTNQGTLSELKKTIKWLDEADFEVKIIIAGNHDITLDTPFYHQHGSHFHNQSPQDSAACQKLLTDTPSIIWLRHESAVIHLRPTSGLQTTFKIFGSHFSPEKGLWAFGYKPHEAVHLWDQIPLDCDVVVTHTPPRDHCDESRDRSRQGCETLREALWRVRPLLAVCGHVHEGRGAELIHWDLENEFKELGVEIWTDPGKNNNKLSFVDLSTSISNPTRGHSEKTIENSAGVGSSRDSPGTLQMTVSSPECKDDSGYTTGIRSAQTASNDAMRTPTQLHSPLGESSLPKPSLDFAMDQRNEPNRAKQTRSETVVINAAIMASSWPHGNGGKKFNKPIVVDIDLPICTSVTPGAIKATRQL